MIYVIMTVISQHDLRHVDADAADAADDTADADADAVAAAAADDEVMMLISGME